MTKTVWPTMDEQLKTLKVARGSDNEELIRKNQEFHMLRAEEANDQIKVPLYLRVLWRKNHPDSGYSSEDPTGGYPRVLSRVHEKIQQQQAGKKK